MCVFFFSFTSPLPFLHRAYTHGYTQAIYQPQVDASSGNLASGFPWKTLMGKAVVFGAFDGRV